MGLCEAGCEADPPCPPETLDWCTVTNFADLDFVWNIVAQEVRKHRNLYYNKQPIISDGEFDRRFANLQNLEVGRHNLQILSELRRIYYEKSTSKNLSKLVDDMKQHQPVRGQHWERHAVQGMQKPKEVNKQHRDLQKFDARKPVQVIQKPQSLLDREGVWKRPEAEKKPPFASHQMPQELEKYFADLQQLEDKVNEYVNEHRGKVDTYDDLEDNLDVLLDVLQELGHKLWRLHKDLLSGYDYPELVDDDLDSHSPTMEVGAPVAASSSFANVEHLEPMRSLDNVFDLSLIHI